MRSRILVFSFYFTLLAAVPTGCGGRLPWESEAPAGVVEADTAETVDRFSGERAFRDLSALAKLGSRAVGTDGGAKAREYIRGELKALGLVTTGRASVVKYGVSEPRAEMELVNLETTIPGESSDLILLAAPYDSAYRDNFAYAGVNDGASGAAVLLELARVLAEDPLPYTTRLYFLDGEAPLGRDGESPTEPALLGSIAVANQLESTGRLRKVRLLVYLNRVSDGDLRVARDRFSHRIYRDAFWRAAGVYGHRDVFPLDSPFEATRSGHRSFVDLGMRRTVAIEGSLQNADGSEVVRFTEEDTLARSSEASLDVVGEVVLAGLRAIGDSLAKIDRFSEAPAVVDGDTPAKRPDQTPAVPEAEPAGEAAPVPDAEAAPAGAATESAQPAPPADAALSEQGLP